MNNIDQIRLLNVVPIVKFLLRSSEATGIIRFASENVLRKTYKTDGWCVTLGDLGPKQPRLEVWIDHFPDRAKRCFWFGFYTTKREAFEALLAKSAAGFPLLRTLTQKDYETLEGKSALKQKFGEGDYNRVFREEYFHKYFFYGMYDQRDARDEEEANLVAERAANFFLAALGRVGTAPLNSKGRRLLTAILDYIKTHRVDPARPETYPKYDEMYRAVEPSAPRKVLYVGHNLRKKGLDDLGEWTIRKAELPKITGLIVDAATQRPGNGFFPAFNRKDGVDDAWWHEEVRKSIEFDWSPYLGTQTAESPAFVAEDLDEDALAPRVKGKISRIVRDTAIVREIKAQHGHTCQICHTRLELSPGVFYSEAHHVKPLGKPHNGPDKKANIICVCPNCHVKLDFAAVKIDLAALRSVAGHNIGKEFVDYHNRLCS